MRIFKIYFRHKKRNFIDVGCFYSHEARFRGFGLTGGELEQNNKNNSNDKMNSAGDDSSDSPTESSEYST